MAAWNQLKPLLYVEKLAYDTTQLDVRVQYEDQDGAHRQVASTHVVQHAWAVAFSHSLSADLQDPTANHDNLCILTGKYGAVVRASENTVGETTADVLNSVWAPDALETPMSKLFKTCVRFVEVDEAGSNARAEALVLEQRRVNGDSGWCHLHVLCLAHKVHAMAAKTWALQRETITNTIAVCKHQRMAGNTKSLSDHVGSIVRNELRVVHTGYHLNAKARQFRSVVQKYLMPPTRRPKLRSMFLAVLEYFNADWTSSTPVHVCTGCCASEDVSRETGVRLLMQLVSHMHPHMFSRANWTSWADTLPFFGLACCFHDGLIARAFVQAFQKRPGPLGAEVNLDTATVTEFGDIGFDADAQPHEPENEQEHIRIENARTLRLCLLYLSRRTEELMQDVFLLRVCLQPQMDLMHAIIHSVSEAWETAQLQSMWSEHVRQFRPLKLHKRADLALFHQAVLAQFLDPTLWQWFVQTEKFASTLLRNSMQSGALAWQTVDLRVQNLPYKLFSLLEREDLEDKAFALLQIPQCGRDDFSMRFLRVHSSVEKLCSQEAHAALYILAHLWTSTTFSTESLHARNLRRSKARIMTQRIEVCDLAVAHSLAPHPWLQSAVEQKKPESTKRKSKHNDAVPEKRRRKNPGSGGAWRAFNHIQLGGRKFDGASVGQLAVAYRALSPNSKHYYETLGAAGALQSSSEST
eukprot:6492192-Amphidinium_carterae.1